MNRDCYICVFEKLFCFLVGLQLNMTNEDLYDLY